MTTQPKKRSAKDLMSDDSKAEAVGKDIYRPEAFKLQCLYLGAYKPRGDSTKIGHIVIPFGLDTLPVAKTLPVDGEQVPIYRHVSKDRLALEISLARVATGKGGATLFRRESFEITEGMILEPSTFGSSKANPLDLVELGNVRLNWKDATAAGKGIYLSLLFDSIRVLPVTEQGLTAMDRALAIYRANTRFVPSILPLASNKSVRDFFPQKAKNEKKPADANGTTAPAAAAEPAEADEADPAGVPEESSSNRIYKRKILNSFPIPLLCDWTTKSSDLIFKKLPLYEAVGDVGDTSVDVSIPCPPVFINNATLDSNGKVVVPAEPRIVAQGNISQLRDQIKDGEIFHIRDYKIYPGSIVGMPTVYPPELSALLTLHRIPLVVVGSVSMPETLNDTMNYGHASQRGPWPDGLVDVKAHAAAFGFERYLLELGIAIPFSLVQERYGSGSNTSTPFIQDDRNAMADFAVTKGRPVLKPNFINPATDKLLALDSAILPLGSEEDSLYFALELKEIEVDDRSALTPEEGAKIVRANLKKILGDESKLLPIEKLHGRWLQGTGAKRIPIFAFYRMDKAYAEKLRSMGNKPLDTAAFFTPAKDPAVLTVDAVATVDEYRLQYYLKGTEEVDDEDKENSKGVKRGLEDGEGDEDEPETKKARTTGLPNFKDEQTRSGFENEDPMDEDQ